MDHYDLFVIGAGSGGVRAARMSASFGAKVGIAEEKHLGGTCVNVGCVPKKLFVYGSHFAEDFDDAKNYGWSIDGSSFNWHTLRSNKDLEIARLNEIYRNLLESAGAEIYECHAELVDQNTVQLGNRTLKTDKVLVATGSRPTIPDFPGSELVVDSDAMFYLEDLPSDAVVVGGGYIAVEFAGILQGLGVQTTLLYRGELFLRGFDRQIAEFVYVQMQEKGVRIDFQTNVTQIKERKSRKIVTLDNGKEISTELVLYATGRQPLSDGIGLSQLGVHTSVNKGVKVNDRYQSTVGNIFAVGDVIGGHQLTPLAIAEGMSFAYREFKDSLREVNYDLIPTAIFCQPNIGTVGPTEDEAKELYPKLQVYESDFKPMKHTISKREERSLMKLLVDGDTDQVVAAHMVGADAGELIQGLAVAITARATKADFDRTIGIHPTAAEEFVTMRDKVR